MYWHGSYGHDPKAGTRTGAWRCSVKDQERNQRYRDRDPIGYNRRHEERRRAARIERMTNELENM